MRRPSPPRGVRTGWRIAAPAVCLLAGLLFAVSHNAADGYDLRGGRTTELSGLVRDADARVGAAEQRLGELRAQLRQEEAASGADQRVAEARRRADGLSPVVGLTPLRGAGLRVTLTDAPRGPDGRYPSGAKPNDLVVHQQDLQSALNALWGGGAEAISVADQRLTSTSAPRCVGNTLLLHGRTYSPPYVINAIGDPDRMTAALEAEPGVRVFRQYVQTFGLGYRVERVDDLRVPGYTGSLRLDDAQEVPR
ncbi:DUF881 domain-containing protein [Streptoalloteichus hindustanus]|uniref:Uncharacterized conserved protein YlxW, UPF0749 family n=1 Tax=Streptoalloteichus hindustanus TaxID=2017 RepID=A0A1M4V5K9_STRHI|nr:DUF881 domain-containing protein [Streptoalloteichus hindustanus]SHE64266.1 Uncharacterized conserved protein YlxW, UPF0749 family [Streptoalloteichus hindustanus]